MGDIKGDSRSLDPIARMDPRVQSDAAHKQALMEIV